MTIPNRLLYAICIFIAALHGNITFASDINGAGATFPYPIYAKWTAAYKIKTGADVNYQPIGSSGGIKQIQVGTVDFGATDAPLNASELELSGLIQFPAVIGGVVPVVNLPGIAPGQLKLDGKVLADIFLGRITQWNDPRITADNAAVPMPNETISVVHRNDGAGTTFIFTNFLSQIDSDWNKRMGADKTVSWPIGTGGKGDDGVASYVQRIKNSIGYVEFAYALKNNLVYAQVKNRDGQFVSPNKDTFNAAAGNAQWDPSKGFYEILTDEPGVNSWPITGATYILIARTGRRPESTKEVLNFFDWAFSNGDMAAVELGYAPLPSHLKAVIREVWKSQVKDASGNALWQ